IPVFNNFKLTYNCVQSIIEQGADVPFEIVIVDDGSRDETLFAGFVFGTGIRLIRSPENGGFIRACNRGAEAARGDYIVFLNNDTEGKARWLGELYERFVRDSRVLMAGATLLYPQGTLEESGGVIWRLGAGCTWGGGEAPGDRWYWYVRHPVYESGAGP